MVARFDPRTDTQWVVYAKPPFGGADQVYRYLGRYTHRVAISNARLISLQAERVRFHHKDYADGATMKQMTLTAEEFIRRFLLHVLPKGFVRIRHDGLLASPHVQTKLQRCQWLLGPAPSTPTAAAPTATWMDQFRDWLEESILCCPHCGGRMTRIPFEPGTLPQALLRNAVTSLPNIPTLQDTS